MSQHHRYVYTLFERKIVVVFLPINLNICFGCSKEPSHRDGSMSTHNIYFGIEFFLKIN